MSAIEQVRREAMRLPPEERARLVRELIESLDELDEADQAAVDAMWAEEVRRRVEDLHAGRAQAVDGEKTMDRLRERFTK